MKIFGFLHVALMNDWEEVLSEQLRLADSSGLLSRSSSIQLGLVGLHADHVPAPHPAVQVGYRGSRLDEYEFPTLALLQDACREHDCLVWYLHSKGVSHRGRIREFANDWRRYMQHFIVEQHAVCIRALNDADLCGVNWQETPYPHFSGNFFWARASHIRRLPEVRTLDWRARHLAEAWAGSAPGPRVANLFTSGVNHYESAYPPNRYVQISQATGVNRHAVIHQ